MAQIALFLAIWSLAFAAAGCSYSGGVEQPLTRKATWFSYLNGDDLRDRCAASRDTLEVRLIYNGNFKEQVRTYEIRGDGAGGAILTARAKPQDAGNLANITLSDPLAGWRWRKTATTLGPDARARLISRLADSGVFQRAPSGIDLKSWGSYWVAIACRDGQVSFNAWTKGSARWNRQELWQIVQPFDTTGVAYYRPHPARFEDSPALSRGGEDRRAASVHFLMTTGDNGLTGLP